MAGFGCPPRTSHPHLHFEIRKLDHQHSSSWTLVGTSSNWSTYNGKNTGYYLSAQQMVNDGLVDPSDFVAQNATSTSPPTAPSNVTATALNTSQIKLTWTDASSNEQGFEVYRWSWTTNSWQTLNQVGPNVTAYTDSGLSPGETYYYFVGAYNSAGSAFPSSYVYATTPTSTSPPTAPSNVAATALNSSQIKLTWTDASSNEQGFEVYRWSWTTNSWQTLDQVGPNVTAYTDGALSPGETYYYFVGAYNSAGYAYPSSYVYATTYR